jgi:RHS repeat-associated protein
MDVFAYDAWGDMLRDTDLGQQTPEPFSDDTDSNGVVDQTTGEVTPVVTSDLSVGYKGQYGYVTNPSTGLILAGQREYNPMQRRWMNRDPIGTAGGMNLYAYCGGDPVNEVDPSGTDWKSIQAGWHKFWFGTVTPNQPVFGADNPTIDENRDVDGVNDTEEGKATAPGVGPSFYSQEKNVAVTMIGGAIPGDDAAEAEALAVEKTSLSVADKLKRYLLNFDHPIGASKAQWFKKALGFDESNASDLAKQIIFDSGTAVETGTTKYGTKYNQVIEITGANGRSILVTFAWIRNNDGIVRLVTAIPTPR